MIKKIVVLGGGTAGFLSALMFRLTMPQLQVAVVRSSKIPVIGVGESTTTAVPRYLHDILNLDRQQFFREVRPVWKLGIRYEWGDPGESHFNYTFDRCMEVQLKPLTKLNAFHCLHELSDASPYSALMDRNKAPCRLDPTGRYVVDEGAGYHIENKSFIAYLEGKSAQYGAELIDGDVVEAIRSPSGDISGLKLEDGRQLDGDFFIDCSGFRSMLLSGELGVPFVSYTKSLFCDSAVIGSWRRDDEIRPYTTAETMEHGWCWRIDFEDQVTRGYVFSSAFCDDDEAMREIKEKNPRLGDDLRVVRFKSGRMRDYWVNNVAAIGNASGFVEPLEATAIHLIIEQLRLLRLALHEGDCRILPRMRAEQNQRFAEYWDDVRDFLAVHYKFNRWSDSPFWRHCREDTDLGSAAPLLEMYRDAGPTTLCNHLIPRKSIFGFNGYLTMLVGQRVPTDCRRERAAEDVQRWEQFRRHNQVMAEHSLSARDAMRIVHDPNWHWPRQGL